MSGTRRSGGSSGGGGGGTNNNRTSSRSSSSSNRNSGGGGTGGSNTTTTSTNNNDNHNDSDDGLPPDFRNLMMHLMMSGGVGLGGNSRNGPESLTKPSSVKCPTCNVERDYAPALAVGPMKHRYSHNARVLWHPAKCPVCIEDKDPPVVNLMCGHVLCLEHFERLNGKVGEDAMLSVADQLAKEREELRNRRSEDDNGNDDTTGAPRFQALLRPGMMPVAAMRGGNGPPGRGHSFQFLPDSDHLMDLVMRDFGNHGEDDDEDDDDDEEQYDDDDDDDDDSDYDDMPSLIANARQAAAALSTGSRTTANNPSISRVTNPRRGGAAAVSNNNNNRRSATSNATSNNTGNASNNNDGESSSDEDSIPGLVPRLEAVANRNNNTNRPAPRQQPSPPPPGDDNSDDSEMPPLAPRGNTNRGTANDDDTSSSDSEAVPGLLDPNEDVNTSDDEEEEDDDVEEMPDLVPRDIEVEDLDGSDDDMPDLLVRRQDDEDDTSSDDDDDEDRNISSSDDERDMPGLIQRGAEARRPRANNRNRRRRPDTGDSSDDSDNESIPGLIQRLPVETGGVRNPNGSVDSDDSSNDGDSMPELLHRDVDSADEEESPPPAAAAAARVVPTREMIGLWTAEEMAQGRRMKPGELKRELRSMNVDTATFFEKPELVRAYVEQMVQRRVDNYVPTPAEVRAAASAAAAAPPPVVDPYADMPPLILAEDPPPKHGIWLLSPASSSSGSRHDERVVLHYAFVQASRVKSVQRGFFPKGSIILSAKPGLCWIYAPSTTATARSNPGVAAAVSAASTTTGTNNHSWELFAVRDVNVTVQMFTFEWPGADEASLVADGRGAAYVLLPTDPSNATTCDRTLIRINSQYEDGKNVLQQLVPRHSHLYRDRAGGVYIHVPNHNNGGVTTRTNEDSERLSPGIWYITPFQVTCLVSHVSPDAKINLDGNRTGLLLLSPVEDNDGDDDVDSSLLVHVGPSGELHRRIIPVNLTKVAAVLDDGERGALIHCRNSDNRWKLCRAAWEEVNEKGKVNAPLVEFVDCPGRTKLVTDGRGGVWIWKKVGKRNNRAVSYISREGELTESVESFPGRAVMEG